MRPALLTGAALLAAMTSLAVAQNQAPPNTASPGTTTAPGTAGSVQHLPGQTPTGATARPAVSDRAGTMNSADTARVAGPADSGGAFTNVPAQTGLTSKLVGLSVYNSENTDVGTIKDIAFDASGVQAYIVAVGGFMGMGDHYVAVKPSAITIRHDIANDKWRASMNTNEDQLKAAPEFRYSSAG